MERYDFDALVVLQRHLLLPEFCGKIFGVSHRIAQIELCIGVLIDADSEKIRRALAPQAVRTADRQHRIRTLDVVTIESVGCQAICSGAEGHVGVEGDVCLSLEDITAPDLDERAVAKQAYVLCSGWRIGDVNLHLHATRGERGCRWSVHKRQTYVWLAAVFLQDVLRGLRTLAGEEFSEQSGRVVLVEENLDWRNIEELRREAPENLAPRGGRAVKQTIGCGNEPVLVIERHQARQLFARLCLPQSARRVSATAGQHATISAEGEPRDPLIIRSC